ncbi:MAG: hypothetical protein K8R73_00560 [Clostridiales bacterium]|nr:hypothetical protein [Clostridiales bacterium]
MRPISDTQPLMKSIFPGLEDFPLNVMITSVTKQNNGIPIISFLVIVDDNSITKINHLGNHVNLELFTYTEVNPNGFGKDFFLKFKFLCNSEELEYVAEITANNQIRQIDFIQALKTVDKINVWFANKDRKVEKVISIDFDYQVVKPAVTDLLTPISVTH